MDPLSDGLREPLGDDLLRLAAGVARTAVHEHQRFSLEL
jgi:hypothetical protein